MNKIIVLMCFIWVIHSTAFDMLITKNYCRDYWFPVLILGLTLLAFKTSFCAQSSHSNDSLHQKIDTSFKQSIRWIIYTNGSFLNQTVTNLFNKKTLELRIRCNTDKIGICSLSKALLKQQPLLNRCAIPIEFHNTYEHYDIDLWYVSEEAIRKTLRLINKIANAKNASQRTLLYRKTEKNIWINKTSLLQALEYQTVLNGLCLRCNVDTDQMDTIPALISDKSYYESLLLSSKHKDALAKLAQYDQSLQPIISLVLSNK